MDESRSIRIMLDANAILMTDKELPVSAGWIEKAVPLATDDPSYEGSRNRAGRVVGSQLFLSLDVHSIFSEQYVNLNKSPKFVLQSVPMRKSPVHMSISIVAKETPVNGTLAATAVPVTLQFHSLGGFFALKVSQTTSRSSWFLISPPFRSSPTCRGATPCG